MEDSKVEWFLGGVFVGDAIFMFLSFGFWKSSIPKIKYKRIKIGIFRNAGFGQVYFVATTCSVVNGTKIIKHSKHRFIYYWF